MNTIPWTASGERAVTPSPVPIHSIVNAIRISSAKPPTASGTPVWIRQPITSPLTASTVIASTEVASSAIMCPSR